MLALCSFKTLCAPRGGVIIKWPLNGQFNYAVTNVLTSQTDVSEMVAHGNGHE